MRRSWIGLIALVGALVLLLPVPQAWADTLPQLFDRALVASREGDFVSALPLWDAVIERV